MSAPLNTPVIPGPKPSVASPPDAHDRSVHSIPRLHNPHTCRSPGSQSVSLPSTLPREHATCTSEPIRYDTDSVKSKVITYEICSLLPPSFQCCCNNSEEGIAVSGLQANPIRGRRSQSHMTTPIGCRFLGPSKRRIIRC